MIRPGLACATLLVAHPLASQATMLAPGVDERMELLGIAYRVAVDAFPADTMPAAYGAAVQAHFGRWQDHPFIRRLRQLADSAARAGGDLGAWEIPSLALHLGPAPEFVPLVPARDSATADGWDDRSLLDPALLSLLRQFYRDSRAEEFFAGQAAYFQRVEAAYRQRFTPVAVDWLGGYLGTTPTEEYHAVASLAGLGGGDYVRVNFGRGRRNTQTIVLPAKYDEAGLPVHTGSDWISRSSLHEVIHAYTNQVVDRHAESFRPAFEFLVREPRIAGRIQGTFYDNWQYLCYESVVRAVAIRYLAAGRGIRTTTEAELAREEQAGFLWMRGLVEALERYERERRRYPTIASFAPELARYFDGVALAMREGRFRPPA